MQAFSSSSGSVCVGAKRARAPEQQPPSASAEPKRLRRALLGSALLSSEQALAQAQSAAALASTLMCTCEAQHGAGQQQAEQALDAAERALAHTLRLLASAQALLQVQHNDAPPVLQRGSEADPELEDTCSSSSSAATTGSMLSD